MMGVRTAKKSVERIPKPGISGEAGRMASPHRQFLRAPASVCTATPQDSMLAIATKVASRIRANRYSSNCGSYVLGMADGKIYVLSEENGTTAGQVRDKHAYLVGLYAADTKDRRRAICPKAEDILGDLHQHFTDIGFMP